MTDMNFDVYFRTMQRKSLLCLVKRLYYKLSFKSIFVFKAYFQYICKPHTCMPTRDIKARTLILQDSVCVYEQLKYSFVVITKTLLRQKG